MANNPGPSRGEAQPANSFEAQHAAIVARTLRWADEAAARHDYVEAVRWVEMIRSLGERLPDEYKAKRETWLGCHRPDATQRGS